MKISKFCNIKKINKMYCLFNSLLLKPVFLSEEEFKNFKDKEFEKLEIDVLKKNGVLVSSRKKDKIAVKKLRQIYEEFIKKPQFAYFAVTNACNLKCKYCFIENNSQVCPEQNMKFTIAQKAVDRIDEFCCKKSIEKFEILFYGGEPLIKFDLIQDIINYTKLKKTKFEFSIITNATLLNESTLNFIKENKIKLGISIDGPKKINDANRIYKNKDGSVYDDIIDKIKPIIDKGISYCLSMTLSSDVLDNKNKILEWIKQIGVNNIAFNLMHMSDKNSNWKDVYEKSADFLFGINKELNNIRINEDRVERNWRLFNSSNFKFSDCGATGLNQITIKPNGDVIICHGDIKNNKNICGNISTDSIEKCLNSKNKKVWINRSPIKNRKCLKCPAIYLCGGGCANESFHMFGGLKKIDKPFCIFTKKALENIIERCYNKVIGG